MLGLKSKKILISFTQHRKKGGNAANNSVVLSELGIQFPEFFGVLPGHPAQDLEFIRKDFLTNKVSYYLTRIKPIHIIFVV